MSLADRLDVGGRRIGQGRLALILWLAAVALLGAAVLLVTLQRLGLSLEVANAVAAGWIVCAVVLTGWTGRTIKASRFFFADRAARAAPLGIGGISVWCSGAFVLLYFGGESMTRALLLVALFTGIALYGCLFAGPMRASMAASISGALSWRYESRGPAFAILPGSIIVVILMMVCEQTVSAHLFARFSGLSVQVSSLVVMLLAVIPALLGGWTSLFIINAVLGLWVLIALLLPAIVVGFMPFMLPAPGAGAEALSVLVLRSSEAVLNAGASNNSWTMVGAFLVLATGFASLPQALARASLATRRSAAVETAAWSALALFLMVSAFGLSIGLVIAEQAGSPQAVLLQSQIALAIMPHVALFFLTFNALSTALWVAASTLTRTLRSGRLSEPGGGSMFTIRVLLIGAAVLLGAMIDPESIDAPRLLVSTIALSSSALFVPLFCTFWIGWASRTAVMAAALAGCLIPLLWFLYSSNAVTPEAGTALLDSPLRAGGVGLVASILCVVAVGLGSRGRTRRGDRDFAKVRKPGQ